MEPDYKEIAKSLIECEANGFAPSYIVSQDTYKEKGRFYSRYKPGATTPVQFKSAGEEIFVVSDLHIASGRSPVGVYAGTENFFADDSFSRFLKHAGSNKKTKTAILIINGDVFDFLRVVEYPGRKRKARLSKRMKRWARLDPIKAPTAPSESFIEAQFLEWKQVLEKIGIPKTMDELKNISRKEKIYGLKTHDYKSVWKLHLIQKGHAEFFDALAVWMQAGNKLIIVKGNHDTEWYWLAVRNYFRLVLAERVAGITKEGVKQTLQNSVLPNITFIDDSVLIDEDFYIEHGHRYDKYTMILKSPTISAEELNIPFGSFFNRYVINRIELFLPYIDNVRPTGNILPILMRENFPLALKVLFQHLPFAIRVSFTFQGRYIWFMFKRVLVFVLPVVIPLALLVIMNFQGLKNAVLANALFVFVKKILDSISLDFLRTWILNTLQGFGLLFLSYVLARFISWLQLTEPDSLESFARERSKDNGYRILTMGHTHNPGEYLFWSSKHFYNTGTWIPVIETSNAEVREDKTYTFLHLERDANGKLVPANNGLLQRWNDEAGRPETQILVQRK
jgi:UDP-2,3-diacylglucosamine pyrophosphatase LpxH